MTSSYLERNRERLYITMNHQMSQAGNLTNRIIKMIRKISKIVQMKIPKLHKGTNLLKLQLIMIATQEKTSWT